MAAAGKSNPSLLTINDTKAGMQGLDKEKINAIIHEASKGSAFYKFQQQRQDKIDRQIAYFQSKKAALAQQDILQAEKEMDVKVKEYKEMGKDLAHLICHLDMDMFYAAVEIRDQPELKDKPVAVGSMGMIATSNYVARNFGVRAGMAGFIGKKLCPHLTLIRPNFRKYKEASQKVMTIIEGYDPNMRSASLDEAYFDLTNHVIDKFSEQNNSQEVYMTNNDGYIMFKPEVWNFAESVLSEIRRKIHEATQLTCSAGLTHNSMLSKVCSDLKKPDGQFILKSTSPQAVDEFVSNISVRKIPGIGPVGHQHLTALEINTCRDLLEKRGLIKLLFNPATIEFYLRVSMGISSTCVEPHDKRDRKSLGAETSFKAIRGPQLFEILKSLAQEVSDDLKKRNLCGRVIVLRVKWESFKSCVRHRSIASPTNDFDVIYRTVTELLNVELKTVENMKIRLLGVRVAGFPGDNPQASTSSSTDNSYTENAPNRSLLPFLNKSIKDSIVWKITYDSGEIETNADPTDIAIYEDQEPTSFAHVCLYCSTLFKSEAELSNHINESLHFGLPDECMEID